MHWKRMKRLSMKLRTPNANMADHSAVGAEELHVSEVSQSSMFCFENASPRNLLLRRRSVLFYFTVPTSGELMWCPLVFQHDFHGQYLPQVKEKLFLKDILCLKRRNFLRSLPLARNRTKRCNNQANELQLPRRWNQWKHWAKWQLGAKCNCLHIF